MTYQAPVRDYVFLLRDVLQLERYANLPAFADASMDTVEAILAEAGKFTSEVLAPLNRVGDKQGCTWSPDFSVKTPEGFKDAYAKLVEGGWPALDDTIPEFDPRDLERVGALYAKYGLEDAGPPLQPAD